MRLSYKFPMGVYYCHLYNVSLINGINYFSKTIININIGGPLFDICHEFVDIVALAVSGITDPIVQHSA